MFHMPQPLPTHNLVKTIPEARTTLMSLNGFERNQSSNNKKMISLFFFFFFFIFSTKSNFNNKAKEDNP